MPKRDEVGQIIDQAQGRVLNAAYCSFAPNGPAKAAGRKFGRPPTLNAAERAAVLERLNAGASVAEIAREFKTTRQTILRVRESALKTQQAQL